MMESSRRDRKIKKRKRKKWFVILLILIVLILTALLYAVIEYRKGLKNSQNDSFLPHEKVEFQGVKDKERMNVLLLGVDARGNEKARADTIMIAQYNRKTKQAKIASIMRDSYVDIPGYGKNKINAAYAYGGPELLRKTIKENFDVDIAYFALVDFKGFTKAIDVAFPEGIEINVEKEMSKGIGVTLHPGVQRLHGNELLGYVRFRKDAESDFGRVRRQQEVVKRVMDEFISVRGIAKLPSVVGTIRPYILTNVGYKEVLPLLATFPGSDQKDISFFRIPIDGSFRDATYPQAGAVLEMDLAKNRQALKEFLK
jgi:polyisoprenyl-teichoic acid--peptidoglycan teichoic acid transferase